MSTLKIVEFRSEGMGFFMKYLRTLSEKKGWGWVFEVHSEFSPELLKGATAVKVEPSLSPQVLSHMKVLPTQVRAVEVVDSLFQEAGSWYPRLLLHESMRSVLVTNARDLDIRAPAFVVGDNEAARVVSAVLVEMGIADIYLIGDVSKLQSQKDILTRSQLGVRFHILPMEDLTLQSVSAGIVVNVVDLSQQKSLLTDLSYFNFMKGTGYALDLNLFPIHNLLLEEAERAELRVLHPVLIAEVLTSLWLERLKITEVSKQEIHESWKQFLQENPS
ncbi:MAG: hypothetical protein KUL82_01995 [Bdellovibrio sp.]|nr:hypothetical protein [Bdellovibrio sp.]